MSGSVEVASEVAGSVWKRVAGAGDAVAEGDIIFILESMKMEIPVEAPCAGRITELLVDEGDAVAEDQVVARLDAD